jgi:PAS domain S-box-containing protein
MEVQRSSREWMQALARLRTRAARLRSAAKPDRDGVMQALDDALELADTIRIECAALQQRNVELEMTVAGAEKESEALIDSLPSAIVVTDCAGHVMRANGAAAALLGISQARLRNELLLHFTEDRAAFTRVIRELPRSAHEVRDSARIRPRDRAPFDAAITVLRDPRSGDQRWLWVLERLSEPQMPPRTPFRSGAAPSSSGPCVQ